MTFSRNPTGRSEQERRARIEAVATHGTHQHKQNQNKGEEMKSKVRNTLIIAGLILAALIVGGIDNDYEAQHGSEKTTCNWITTPDGMGRCL